MSTQPVDAEVVAQGGPLAVVAREGNGVMALAAMSETDFEARLTAMKLGQARIERIQRELMVGPTKEDPAGVDYGLVPGTKKPMLKKPGAEKLCLIYGLVPTFEIATIDGDGVSRPHLRLQVTCLLHRGDTTGPVVGTGGGAANSWEKKHRYRGGQRACPSCGCEGTIRRSKFPDRDTGDKGFYCHDKAGGCGAQFKSNDRAIIDQQAGQVDNPDPYDTENTLLKMAEKRAHVDATLRTTATSGVFGQDFEELLDPPPAPREEAPPRAKAQPPQQNSSTITEEQLAKLIGSIKASGLPTEEAQALLKKASGVDACRAVPADKFDAAMRAFSAVGVPYVAADPDADGAEREPATSMDDHNTEWLNPAPQPTPAPAPPPAPVPPSAPATGGTMPSCPKCGKTKPVMKSKFGEGYVCWEKSTREKGCGTKFGGGAAADYSDVKDSDIPEWAR